MNTFVCTIRQFHRPLYNNIALKLVLIFILVLAPGCVDIEQVFTLKSNGSGTIAAYVYGNQGVVDLDDLAKVGALLEGTNVTRERRYLHGRPARIEKQSFGRLSEVTGLSLLTLEYRPNGNGTSTLKGTMEGASTPDDDVESLHWMFSGRHYTFTTTVPGKVINAHPVVIDGMSYYPDKYGTKVSWKVPLDKLMLYQNRGYDIEYKVDYRS